MTTVLTMTTLISSTNASLPKISYVKSIDAYLAFCFFMVFASLIGECHLCSGCLLVSSSAAAWISKAAVVAKVQIQVAVVANVQVQVAVVAKVQLQVAVVAKVKIQVAVVA